MKKYYGSECNESEVDLCTMEKVGRKFLGNVKVISGVFLHNVVIVDVDKKQRKKTEWKPEGNKRNASKLIDETCRHNVYC